MPRPIAFDLSRLYVGALGATPRGIDRVDLGFARHLFDAADAGHCGVLPTLTGMGTVPAPAARRVVAAVERHWRETPRLPADDILQPLERWLAGRGDPPPTAPPARHRTAPWHLGNLVWPARWSGLRPARLRVPRGAVYLNTGQILVGFPACFRWLDRRPDVKAVFMLHDLIPLQFPEYSGPLLARHHARALANVARRAHAMIATSEAAAADIRAGLSAHGRTDIPIHVAALPVSATLLANAPAAAVREPYFVTVGVIDQRKNHRLLLHIWRDMLRHLGPATPKLAILGARGLRTSELHDFVARSPGLSAAVTIVSGLSSAALREILRGARALLMPSFAEGFGLPLIEAEALGVPVVASDLPAHREVAARTARLLDPLDGPGWQQAILELAANPRPPVAAVPSPQQTWDSYLADIVPILEAL